MIFSVFQKNWVFGYSWSTLLWYRCYYPHLSRDALSPVCGIFLLCTVNCILYTMYRVLSTVYCQLSIIYCLWSTVYCVLCTVYSQLCIVYCLWSTVYSLLIAVYWLAKYWSLFDGVSIPGDLTCLVKAYKQTNEWTNDQNPKYRASQDLSNQSFDLGRSGVWQ